MLIVTRDRWARRARRPGVLDVARARTDVATLLGGERWAVVHSDALAVARALPDGCLGAVVTDPPYCSGGYTEAAKRQARGQGLRSETVARDGWFINDNMGTAGLVWLLRSLAVEAHRLLVEGGSLVYFADWRMIPALVPAIESSGLRWAGLPIWDKGSAGLGSGWRHQHEVILPFTKGSGRYHRADVGDVLRCNRVARDEREHQTEKPVELLAKIVTLVSGPGALVGDFFAGSGSTGEACLVNGRRFLGVELLKPNVEKGRRRLAAVERDSDADSAGRGQLSITDAIGRTV